MTTTEDYKDEFGSYMLGVFSPPDIWLERGRGARVYDIEGKEYLDFLAGIAVCGTGHCHPKVVSAISEQASRLMHCTNLYGIPNEVELAKVLCEKTGLCKTFFSNSGAEANEAAIKIARKYAHATDTQKSNIVTASNSFHGRTLVTVTATGQQKYQKDFHPLPPGFKYTPFNDVEALKGAIGADTAAILLEPIQGEGGVIPADKEFMTTARDLCDDHGALLIMDEVQTGIGRSGKFLATDHYGVKADIVSLAKALGSGFPIGATLCSDNAAKAMRPGDHGSTFGGNPLACSAALATLKVIDDENLVENAARMGEYLSSSILSLGSEMIGDVRGMGLLKGVILKEDAAVDVKNRCAGNGLLIGSINKNIIRLAPPLMIGKEDVDEFIEVLEASLHSL